MPFLNELSLPLLAAICLVFGFSYRLHKNAAFTVFALFFVFSDIINPALFLHNEKMYRESPWGFVKDYDFSFHQLLVSYADSQLIFAIISASVLLSMFVTRRVRRASPAGEDGGLLTVQAASQSDDKHDRLIGLAVIFAAASNILLYDYRLGITGVAGEAPFHLSGLTHYVRSYFIPVVLAWLLGKYSPGKFTIASVFIYAYLAGVASASRFVAVIPILILIYLFLQRRRYGLIAFSVGYCLLLWLTVSTSRILTFSKEHYDLLQVIYFSLTENSGESVVGFFDLVTGRLSSAQQVVLAYQLKGMRECDQIVTFLLGGAICANTALNVFNLDLSGTAYGTGLSVIPSIMISSASRWGYVLPAAVIGIYILVTDMVHKRICRASKYPSLGFLYLIFSCIFLFAGPLRFYYYLQAVVLVLFGWLRFTNREGRGGVAAALRRVVSGQN